MSIDYAALKTEITNDPSSLGYAPFRNLSSGDNTIAALLNQSRVGININAGVVPAYLIVNATVAAEWATLSAQEKQRYQTLTGAGQVDTSNPNVQAAFLAMFAAGTATRAALIAIATRQGSRAEQLFGAGTIITRDDVAATR